jgi:hypothetical protein
MSKRCEGMEYNMISNQILQTTVDGLKEILIYVLLMQRARL